VRICPYEVPRIDAVTKKAHIEAAACQGCGICVSECPAKAIVLHHYTDAQIFAKEDALFTEADLAAGVALSVGGPTSDAPAACDIPPEVS
jgi:ferredoxin